MKFGYVVAAFLIAITARADSGYTPYPSYGDKHWKAPCATAATCPATKNSTGDARTALDTFNVYVWNGSSWVSASGGLSTTLVQNHVFVGNASNVATDVAMSGDVGIVASGATTVATVGGSTAANIHTAEGLVNGAQSGNVGFFSPSNGSSGAPSWRAAVAADIPNLAASKITSGQLALARGGTNADLSATGGTSQVLKQVSSGATVTVGQLACADLSNSAASCSTDATNASNIGSGTLPAGRLPNPSAASLGGIQSIAAVASNWIRSISTSGVPAASQPAFTDISGTAAVNQGGTGVTSVTIAPTASSFAGWDANSNLSANNHINGYRTTATAAGTTTLVVGDARTQYFTGSTTQTVKLPVTSTLVTGQDFKIVNLSSGVVTVQSSGANTIQAMAANTQLVSEVILTSGTGTASWNWTYGAVQGSLPATGTVTSVTFTGDGTVLSSTPSSAVTTSGTVTATLKNQNANLVLAGPSSGAAAAPTFRALVQADMPVSNTAKTGNYTVTAADDIVKGDATGGAFTLTLPAASVSGKKYTFVCTATSLANAITIARAGSDTIGPSSATSLKMYTIGEVYELVSDGGTNWVITAHKSNTSWTSYTPTGSWSTNTTYTGFWRRNGDHVQVKFHVATSGAPTSASLTVNLPSSMLMDTAKMTAVAEDNILGYGLVRDSATASYSNIYINYNSTSSVALSVGGLSTFSGTVYVKGQASVTQAAPMTFGASDFVEGFVEFPVANWSD